ncbi:MAG: DUF362 domain-containing protein [Eubacteriales bacterium]|nr:DUF362 domain-containing protein [Eubacteriales bacterium]
MPEIIIAACRDYEAANVDKAFAKIFSEMETGDIFAEGEKILLKPNLLSAKTPDQAVTTHPQIMRGIAAELLNRGLKLSYGDSPAVDNPEKAARVSGIKDVMDELGIPQANFSDSFTKEYSGGTTTRKFQFVQAVADNDGIVNVCKFKTHALTRITGALKNLFGLIPGVVKAKDHVRFPDELRFTSMLADMNRILPSRLHVMDAVIGMEGNGPSGGVPRHVGYIMASVDPVALDSFCAAMMGIAHKGIPVITAAVNAGLGTAELGSIDIVYFEEGSDKPVREKADSIIGKFRLEGFVIPVNGHAAINILNTSVGTFLKRLVIKRPVVMTGKCTKCRVCVKVCPLDTKAIRFSEKNNRIEYDYAKCIRCFCCQELCPHGAIEVREAPLGFLIKAPHEKRR